MSLAPAVKHTKPLVGDNLTILLYGSTGSGKTAQIGELAEYYYAKYKKRTRLYTADRGGYVTINPYIKYGIIDPIPMFGDNPFSWVDHAVKGDKLVDGKWVPGVDPDIALYAFEGFTSIADAMMGWMANASARGINIGGGGSFSFNAGEGADKMKIGSSNMAHYSVAQSQAFEKSVQSQNLPGTILWTAGDKRGEDDANGGVIGPQISGKALTGEAPRWFKITARLITEIMPGQEPKHVMLTDAHMEMQGKGMAKGISNSRVPLAGADVAPIPSRIEPASLVQLLQLLESRQTAAEETIKRRLGLQ